ncbi:C6 transcription factor [Thelonectria olida]|uniref:C6 transcription factor n=1 Tax=Thelonectria olida TaxID=1576542 RepID=A0A9P8VPW4_9HYPO|nr:C6 transcription factor [Thelonectria olida]
MEKRRTPATEIPSHAKAKAPPQLSCEHCRDRKVKCDKLAPCSNCVSHGLVCKPVQRLRLPRGRHAQRTRQTDRSDGAISEDLAERIRHLEAMIDEMRASSASSVVEASTPGFPNGPSAHNHPSSSAHVELEGPGVNAPRPYAGNASMLHRPESFWENLAAEVHGLRDVVESALGDAENDSVQAPDPAQMNSAKCDMAPISLIGLDTPAIASQSSGFGWTPNSVDQSVKRQLCQVYLRQVDPIIKILHRPSLEAWMVREEGYFGYPDQHPSLVALSSAVCFAAASSLTEAQCLASFYTSKTDLVTLCRRECEVAIERSGLLSARDINVLQAFVLYLYARKTEERSKAVWTLAAIAVRVARGLGLHLRPSKCAGRSETFFDQQMRSRLWLTICLIDMQSLFIQAIEPMIGHTEVASALALVRHINDSDFDQTTTSPVSNREGLTDMTFALVTYHLQLAGRQLNFSSHAERKGANTKTYNETVTLSSDWDIRQRHAQQFEKSALQLLHFCDPESSVHAWFAWHGTQCLVSGIRLSVLRPLHGGGPPPPQMRNDTELLCIALSILEKTQLMHTDPRGEGFRWYITIPWNVVAIAIAECYVCADITLIRRAWPIVEACYQQHEEIIARYSGGILQGPLGKLMRRTREKLTKLLDGGGTMDGTSSMTLTGAGPTDEIRTEAMPTNADAEVGGSTVAVALQQPQQTWHSTNLAVASAAGSQATAIADAFDLNPSLPLAMMDQSWKVWEDFVSDIPWEEVGSSSSFFFENDLGGL